MITRGQVNLEERDNSLLTLFESSLNLRCIVQPLRGRTIPSLITMGVFSRAIVAATCISSTIAIDIIVQSSGGNLTGKFGHPYGYGFLHEACFPLSQ